MDKTRKRVLWVFGILAVLCPGTLCGFGFFFYNSWFASPAHNLPLERRLARQEGLPLTLEDLKRRPVKAEENAATVYRPFFDRISRELRTHPDLLATCKRLVGGKTVSVSDKKAAEKELLTIRESLNQIAAASRRPYCDFGRTYALEERHPEMNQGRTAAILLCAKAGIEARAGKLDDAYATLAAAERLGRHLGQAPTVLAMLVRLSCDSYVFTEFGELLSLSASNSKSLKVAETTLAGFGPLPDLKFALRGEVVVGQTGLERRQSAEEEPLELPKVISDAMRAKVLHRMRQIFAELPDSPRDWPKARMVLKRHAQEVDADHSPSNVLCSIVIPSLPNWADAIGSRQARERLALTALRLVMEHAATGGLPSELPNLGLDSVDPFSGKAFVYLPDSSGFRLYSVGRNYRDDGGIMTDKSTTGDIVVDIKFR